MTNSNEKILITAGADTHKDTHTVAALDGTGRLLGVPSSRSSIPTLLLHAARAVSVGSRTYSTRL